jgi:hypothetical protein
MPEMQLPALKGMGDGLGSGLGGFELMPDVANLGLLGGMKSLSAGNDFEGTLYLLEQDRRGQETDMDPQSENELVRRFIETGGNEWVFAPYYRYPQKLYTTHFIVPPISSELVLEQFGVQTGKEKNPDLWVLHYRGKISRKEGGRFRFWGMADNFMAVLIDKKPVLVCVLKNGDIGDFGDWRPSSDESDKYLMGAGYATVGDWFELEPDVPVQMDVIFGEYAAGWTAAMLTVEDEKENYPRNKDGLPVLPIFKTDDLPVPLMEKIEYHLIRNEAVLNDYLKFNVH